MKTPKILLLSALTFLLLGCGASQKIVETNPALDAMVEKKSFEIQVRSVEPLVTQALSQVANSGLIPPGNSISRIDVTGSGYFIKVAGDSVSANLPYYGERQMGGGYNSNAGVVFDGQAKNMEITKDEGKQSYTINFSITGESETFFVNTVVGTKLYSTTAIRSSHRNRIRYSGAVQEATDK